MVPVAPVACKARCVQAQYSSDLASAQQCNQTLEARPGHRTTRRAPQVVVDNFDVAESPPLCFIHEVVLTTLAFEVRLDLGLGRLPDIDHCFAFEKELR
jgi:hypothetical protein